LKKGGREHFANILLTNWIKPYAIRRDREVSWYD